MCYSLVENGETLVAAGSAVFELVSLPGPKLLAARHCSAQPDNAA